MEADVGTAVKIRTRSIAIEDIVLSVSYTHLKGYYYYLCIRSCFKFFGILFKLASLNVVVCDHYVNSVSLM